MDIAKLNEPSKKIAFEPLDWQIKPWRDKNKIMILSSGAGTGKSRLACEKIHAFAMKYPESTVLAVRKNRSSMENSTILFLQNEIMGPNNIDVIHKSKYHRFEYSNRSILAYGGLKDDQQRESIRSIGLKGGVDMGLIEEANKVTREDLNEVLARIRGTAADWTQLILCTNPDSSTHHLYVDLILPCLAGELPYVSYYTATVYENKYVSSDYIKNLEMLTGVQKQRLLYGKWVQSSGVVFDNWVDDYDGSDIPIGNVRNSADYIPDGGPVVWWVDDGMTGELKNGVWTAKSHPRAIMFAQLRNNGQVAVFYENFQANKLATDHLIECLNIAKENNWPSPVHVVCDRASAHLHKAVKDLGLMPRYNVVKVDESIKEVKKFIQRNKGEDDPILIMHPRCKHTRSEFLTFAYSEKTGKIIKAFDHGLDAIRYGCWDITFGDNVEVDVGSYHQYTLEPDFDRAYDHPEDGYDTYGIDTATYKSIINMEAI